MSEPIIKMTGGVIRQQKNTILKNVNVEIQSGEFIYLIGKVGSGKSSFLKTLYAELPLEYGNGEVAGFQLKKIKKSQIPLLRRKCGIVFQDFKLLIDRNVYENLEFVLRATGWKNKKAIRERIETVLTKVGMTDKQQKMPHQLSGGEQQRIVLARALLNAPPLILADEPTGNIDPETSYQLIELLKEICSTGKTIIIATHQYDLIEKYPGRVLCCENGELYEKTTSTVIPETVSIPAESISEPQPEILPADLESGQTDSRSEGTVNFEDETKESPVGEKEETTGNIPVATPETKEPATPEAPAKEILPETPPDSLASAETPEEEEDIMALIGKLDYPEITAFDYEIPEITEPEKPESVQKPEPESVRAIPQPEVLPASEAAPADLAEETPQNEIKAKNAPLTIDLELD